jgi:hypothetical protein
MNTLKYIALFSVLLILTGCATNPYSKFYQDFTGGLGVVNNPQFVTTTGEPRIIQGSDINLDQKRLREDGFSQIGESSFNAADATRHQALKQAKIINAEVVIVYQQYTDTQSGSIPLTQPDTRSSTTYFSGNAYGSGGYATMSGSAVQTTYGTKTTYMPYSVMRYDFYASFWAKVKPFAFGAHLRPLTDGEKRSLGSNKGAAIDTVIRDSPAFDADILSSDIIRRIQNEVVSDPKTFLGLLNKYRGQEIELEIVRDGQILKKRLTLNK